MFNLDRRLFLGTSLAGLTSLPIIGQDAKTKDKVKDDDKQDKEPPSPKTVREDAPFQPSTLFLTWHRDPTTTMDIQWVGTTGETADIKIYYTSDPIPVPPKTVSKDKSAESKVAWKVFETKTRPYPLSDFKVFRAELSDLKPDTDYSFRIGTASPIYKFRTMPSKATNTIHFISGGDCGVNSAAIANNILAARQDPMFAIIGGDLGYDNGRSIEVSLAFLRNYSRHMVTHEGRLIPLITCIGNHEVNGGYGQPREKATFYYPLFEGLYPDTGYASLDFGDYLSLVLLDTGHTTPIAGEQTYWLEQTLKARIDHPNVFVINHVPAYPSYRNPFAEPAKDGKDPKPGTGEAQRKHWVPLFDKYRVPIVLEHHDHTFKRTKPLINGLEHQNGVLYLGDGSWGRIRNPKVPNPLHVMAKTSHDYHTTLHRIQGEERFHLAMEEHGRVMDVSRTGQRKKGIH